MGDVRRTASGLISSRLPDLPKPRWGDSLMFDGTEWRVRTNRDTAYFYDDFWGAPNVTPYNGWDAFTSGTAASVVGAISGANYPSTGCARLTPGTTSSGIAAMIYSQSVASAVTGGFTTGAGVIRFRARTRFTTQVPDGTQNASLSIGLSQRNDATTTAEAVHMVYDGTNGYWYLNSRTASVTTSLTPSTNIAATLNVFQTVEFVIAADGLSAQAFVDGVSIGTLSSGFGTTVPLVPHARYLKTAGTTAIQADIDYIEVMQEISRG